MDAKRLVRQRVRARRAELPPGTRTTLTTAATRHLLALPEVAGAAAVLVYAGHGDELPTDGLLEELLARGVRVLLPRVADDRLEVVEITSSADLRPGFRGVREPIGEPTSGPLDVAVVPGVAFDLQGGRLGQGGGHYDRLLAPLPADTLRVGLCFAVQVVERVPRESHDLGVDVVVTEDGAHRVRDPRTGA